MLCRLRGAPAEVCRRVSPETIPGKPGKCVCPLFAPPLHFPDFLVSWDLRARSVISAMAVTHKTCTESTFLVSGNDHALVVANVVVLGIIIGVAVAGPA